MRLLIEPPTYVIVAPMASSANGGIGYCKYRDNPKPWRSWCPHGCTNKVTVCHKWSKGTCSRQGDRRCYYGVHCEPHGAFGAASGCSPPKKQRTNADAADNLGRTTEHVLDLIKTDPVLSGGDRDAKQDYLRRILRALHPDKVNGTTLEPLFNNITKAIVDLKEGI